jgi:hypothetical protein
MSSFILSLATMESVAITPPDSDASASLVAESQKVVKEQTQKLLAAFVAKEAAALQKGANSEDVALYEASRDMVLELLSDFSKADNTILPYLDWLNPSLLTWCTRSKSRPIQTAVHDLLEKTSPASHPQKVDVV